MGFWVVLMNLMLLGMFFWAVAGLVGAAAFAIVYRRWHRRWQRIAAIALGVVGGLCALAMLALAALGRRLP